MIRFKLAVALLAALAIVGRSHAIDILWVGGGTSAIPAEWDLGDNFSFDTNDPNAPAGLASPASADALYGDDMGWRYQDAMLEDPDFMLNDGSYVVMDRGIVGDFHWQSSPNDELPSHGGSVTVSNGSTLLIDSNSAPDGDWGVFDADALTVTGPGSRFETTKNVAFDGIAESGGAWVFGSWDGYVTQSTAINVLDHAQYHIDGQQWFGAYGDNSSEISVSMTVGTGATATFRNGRPNDPGGTYISHDNSACDEDFACGQEGVLDFIYGYEFDEPEDDVFVPVAPKDETYAIDFTGHGGSITVDSSGIWLQVESDMYNTDLGKGVYETSENVTFQQLYDGVSVRGVNTQILKANGSNDLNFNDVFAATTVSNFFDGVVNADGTSASSDGMKVTSIQGAAEGGSNVGDINGDFRVDAADAGILSTNFSSGATPGIYLNQGDIGGGPGPHPPSDDLIDAADVGLLSTNWTGDVGPAPEGSAIANYFANTGEIFVSVNGVSNWWIESASGEPVMVGDAANLPDVPGLATDNDLRIGWTNLGGGVFSYDNINLGAVALSDLAVDDLRLWYVAGPIGNPQSLGVIIPEPTSLLLLLCAVSGLLPVRRRFSD